jgi:hypothetical protein
MFELYRGEYDAHAPRRPHNTRGVYEQILADLALAQAMDASADWFVYRVRISGERDLVHAARAGTRRPR